MADIHSYLRRARREAGGPAVMLSAAKKLSVGQRSFFAALRMTNDKV